MENKQLIKKYALSLYEIGKNEDILDEIQKGMEVVSSLYKSSSIFRYLLLTKKIAEVDKKKILLDTLKKSCCKHILELIFIIIERGEIKSLSGIIDRFFITMNSESGIVPVRIITATALDEEKMKTLTQSIESKLNKKISAKNEVDSNIIGGIKLMVGNKVVDGSISHQLSKIKYALEQV